MPLGNEDPPSCTIWEDRAGSAFLIGLERYDHAAFAPDGTRLVLARTNGALDLWDVSSEPKRLRVLAGTGRLEDVGFSADGQSLLVVNLDGNARVVPVAAGESRLTLPHGAGLKRVCTPPTPVRFTRLAGIGCVSGTRRPANYSRNLTQSPIAA